MKRRELYKRTIGYACNGLGSVVFPSYFIIPIFIFIAIMRPENSLNLLILLVLFYVPAFPLFFLFIESISLISFSVQLKRLVGQSTLVKSFHVLQWHKRPT